MTFHNNTEKVQAMAQRQAWLGRSQQSDIATLECSKVWARERPKGAVSWELSPMTSRVVQARQAEYHDHKWLQVTIRLSLEETAYFSRGRTKAKYREHFVVFEIPCRPEVADFRVADIKLDADPDPLDKMKDRKRQGFFSSLFGTRKQDDEGPDKLR